MSEYRQIAPAPAPAIRPGEIWLVEQGADAGLTPLDRRAVASANVILYDRALESLIAEILPLGTYAEPLPGGGQGAGSMISLRALGFASDGWSVVQIVEARPGCRERVHVAVDDPLPLVFGPFAAGGPAPGQAFTANGLAG